MNRADRRHAAAPVFGAVKTRAGALGTYGAGLAR